MTYLGTRPPTVDEWDKYELHHRARLATKPGLTGMWQVSGRSNITDMENLFYLFIDQEVKKPKALGDIRGASYIYPILWRFSLIRVSEVIEKKMGKQR